MNVLNLVVRIRSKDTNVCMAGMLDDLKVTLSIFFPFFKMNPICNSLLLDVLYVYLWITEIQYIQTEKLPCVHA